MDAAIPLPLLRNLLQNFRNLEQRIAELEFDVLREGQQTAATWPELVNRYNSILQYSAIISEQLVSSVMPTGDAAALLIAQAQHAGWPRPPHNSLPALVVHPSLPVPDGAPVLTVFGVLQTDQQPVVREAMTAAVQPFLRQSTDDPEQVLNQMKALREEHDGRAIRAERAVRILKLNYHWKARPDFAAEEAAEALEQAAAADKADATQENVHGDEDGGDDEVEEQVLVDRGQSEPINVDDDSDGPLDPDDDLFEEVA